MRKFYSSCNLALHFSIEKDVTATTMWLRTAKEERDKLRKKALARCELMGFEEVDNYFATVVQACMDHWTDGPVGHFYELIRPNLSNDIPSDNRIVSETCSLSQRWADPGV